MNERNKEVTRILIVEKDRELANKLSMAFVDLGYIVSKAQGVFSSFMIARLKHYAAILVDIEMFGGHGIDVVEYLKKFQPNAVMMVAVPHTKEELVKKLRNRGIDLLIDKPLNVDVVVNLVNLQKTVNKKI